MALDGLNIGFNIVLVTIWSLYSYLLLKPKAGPWVALPAVACAHLAVFFLGVLLPEYLWPLRSVLPILSGLACAFLFYKAAPLKKCFIVGLYIGLTAMAELITALLCQMILGSHMAFYELSWAHRILMYLLYLSLLLLALYVCVLFSRRGFFALPARQMLLFIFFPFSQYILLALALWTFTGTGRGWMLWGVAAAVFLCVFADTLLLSAMSAVAKKARLEEENKQLAQTLVMQYGYYAAITEQYRQIRKLRHDIANHVCTVRLLIQNGKLEQARAYANEVSGRK